MAADQTWGLFFFRLATCRESLYSTKGSTEAVAWKCQSFQIPEMRDAAVLSSVNFSGESPSLLFTHCCFMNHILLQDSTVVSILPSFLAHVCFGAPTLLCFIVTVEWVTLTFSILLCILCLLCSSFTSAIKLYDSRQELFTSVWRQFDKAWVNIDLAMHPTEILRDCITGFQIRPILSKLDDFHGVIVSKNQKCFHFDLLLEVIPCQTWWIYGTLYSLWCDMLHNRICIYLAPCSNK